MLGDWTVVTFRNAANGRVLLVHGLRGEPASTRDAVDETVAWAASRSSSVPVGEADVLFAGDLAPFVAAFQGDRVEVEIVAGYDRGEALEEVVRVAKRHRAAGRFAEPVPRAAPRPRRASSSPSTRSRAVSSGRRRSTARPKVPKPPPPPEPKPCPSCFMYPTSRAVQDGECDQCGAALG